MRGIDRKLRVQLIFRAMVMVRLDVVPLLSDLIKAFIKHWSSRYDAVLFL